MDIKKVIEPKPLRKLLKRLIPPVRWQKPVIILFGIMTGLGISVFQLSNAISYLSDDPRACINCHVMTPEYATWEHSSHRQWATCNDCHVPHDNILRKYYFKAQDGFRHASMFTLRLEPQVIQIKDAGKTVVQENCIRCHLKLVNPVSIANVTYKNFTHGEGSLCWTCHRETPHGRTHSLASTPDAIIPGQTPAIPEWIRQLITTENNEGE
jgi:cytochrome c nitrite reductase small subunit